MRWGARFGEMALLFWATAVVAAYLWSMFGTRLLQVLSRFGIAG